MIPPHELSKKEFSRVLRGYSINEVDDHINFILEKYVELYRANNELERRLNEMTEKYNEISNDQETIRTALIEAKKASAKIIKEANEKADIIVRASKSGCDKVLNEFRYKVNEEKEKLIKIQNEITSFKSSLFDAYQTHITQIEQISELADWSDIDYDEDESIKKIVADIKNDVAYSIAQRERFENDTGDSIDIDLDYFTDKETTEDYSYTPEPLNIEPESRLDEVNETVQKNDDDYIEFLEQLANDVKEDNNEDNNDVNKE